MNLDTGQRMSANKWIECRLAPSILASIERLAEAEGQPLMIDGPSLFWHTAHGDIPLPDFTDPAPTADPVPSDVPLYDDHQGASHEVEVVDDATIIVEDIDDSDDSDYEPAHSLK